MQKIMQSMTKFFLSWFFFTLSLVFKVGVSVNLSNRHPEKYYAHTYYTNSSSQNKRTIPRSIHFWIHSTYLLNRKGILILLYLSILSNIVLHYNSLSALWMELILWKCFCARSLLLKLKTDLSYSFIQYPHKYPSTSQKRRVQQRTKNGSIILIVTYTQIILYSSLYCVLFSLSLCLSLYDCDNTILSWYNKLHNAREQHKKQISSFHPDEYDEYDDAPNCNNKWQ